MIRNGAKPPGFDGEGVCTALKEKRCSIYENRPLVCRLWGVTKAMRCPFGCAPSSWVSDQEAGDLIERMGELREQDRVVLKLMAKNMRGDQVFLPGSVDALDRVKIV